MSGTSGTTVATCAEIATANKATNHSPTSTSVEREVARNAPPLSHILILCFERSHLPPPDIHLRIYRSSPRVRQWQLRHTGIDTCQSTVSGSSWSSVLLYIVVVRFGSRDSKYVLRLFRQGDLQMRIFRLVVSSVFASILSVLLISVAALAQIPRHPAGYRRRCKWRARCRSNGHR